jgi:hypothetical protein
MTDPIWFGLTGQARATLGAWDTWCPDDHPLAAWQVVMRYALAPAAPEATPLVEATAAVRAAFEMTWTRYLELPAADLPINPYVLGAWLGDGIAQNAFITTADPEVLDQVRATDYAIGSKDILTHNEVFADLRIIGLRDRDAINAWIKRDGTPEQRAELLASLPSLPTGTAWVWSPSWLRIFQQVQIRRRETFDSSATPKAGATPVRPMQRAPVDLTCLRARSATPEAPPADEGVAALRRQVAALQKDLAATRAQLVRIERVKVLAIGRGVLRAGKWRMLEALVGVYPGRLARERLGEITAITPSGGTFGTYLGTLRRNGLVEIPGDQVRAGATLFPA